MNTTLRTLVALTALSASPVFAADMAPGAMQGTGMPMMAMPMGGAAVMNSVPEPDSRQLLAFSPAARQTLRIEMLERLQALQRIMAAIAEGKPQEAAPIAKAGIGMGVMMRHGKRPAEAIPRNYMPESMQPLSKQSHMLGEELGDALASGDRRRIDAKLTDVLNNCVACHNLYRIN